MEPLPGPGRPTKAGELILGYSGEAGAPVPMPQPDVLGRNGTFVGLQEAGTTFTIPKEPVRRRVHGIQTFNVLRGGEYLFMPSLSALRWIADLGQVELVATATRALSVRRSRPS